MLDAKFHLKTADTGTLRFWKLFYWHSRR